MSNVRKTNQQAWKLRIHCAGELAHASPIGPAIPDEVHCLMVDARNPNKPHHHDPMICFRSVDVDEAHSSPPVLDENVPADLKSEGVDKRWLLEYDIVEFPATQSCGDISKPTYGRRPGQTIPTAHDEKEFSWVPDMAEINGNEVTGGQQWPLFDASCFKPNPRDGGSPDLPLVARIDLKAGKVETETILRIPVSGNSVPIEWSFADYTTVGSSAGVVYEVNAHNASTYKQACALNVVVEIEVPPGETYKLRGRKYAQEQFPVEIAFRPVRGEVVDIWVRNWSTDGYILDRKQRLFGPHFSLFYGLMLRGDGAIDRVPFFDTSTVRLTDEELDTVVRMLSSYNCIPSGGGGCTTC